MGAEFWQPIALVLIGAVGTGALMMLRGDFLGRRAAGEVDRRLTAEDKRLAVEISEAEARVNARIDREMTVISGDVKEIKDAIVRIEERMQ